MQSKKNEKLDRAESYIEIAKSHEGYWDRLRSAHKARMCLDAFIAEEARKANSLKPRFGGLSWEEIGKTLGISKSAAFVRYENEKEFEMPKDEMK